MRYPASEKLEIIRLVEESALPVRHPPGIRDCETADIVWISKPFCGGRVLLRVA
jgi:hypothetical protein